ncbi:hypothetical protein Tco_1153128 [Tanacetum coccineum]
MRCLSPCGVAAYMVQKEEMWSFLRPCDELRIAIAFCKDLRPSLDWSQRKGWTLPTVREEVERAAGGDSPLNASSTTGTNNGISVNSSAERQISKPMDTTVFEDVKMDDMESIDSISSMRVEESKAEAAASEEDVD